MTMIYNEISSFKKDIINAFDDIGIDSKARKIWLAGAVICNLASFLPEKVKNSVKVVSAIGTVAIIGTRMYQKKLEKQSQKLLQEGRIIQEFDAISEQINVIEEREIFARYTKLAKDLKEMGITHTPPSELEVPILEYRLESLKQEVQKGQARANLIEEREIFARYMKLAKDLEEMDITHTPPSELEIPILEYRLEFLKQEVQKG